MTDSMDSANPGTASQPARLALPLTLLLSALVHAALVTWLQPSTAVRQPLPGEPLRVALQAGVPAVVDAAPLTPAPTQAVAKPSPRPKPAVPPRHHPVLVRPGLVPKALPLPTKQAALPAEPTPPQRSKAAAESTPAPAVAVRGVATATHGQPERGAGDSSPALYRSSYLHNPKPAYPERSRELGEEGRVEIKVRVGKNGEPVSVAVARSSGYRRLDQSAQQAVQGWRFVPARENGQAIESWLLVPIPFRLENGDN